MHKFNKTVVLMLLFFSVVSLVSCDSPPENVSKEVYDSIKQFQVSLDECFNERECEMEDLENISQMMNVTSETSEDLDIILTSVDLYSKYITFKYNTENEDIGLLKTDYQQTHNELSRLLDIKEKY